MILVNNQLDALFSVYLFISLSGMPTGIPDSHLHRVIHTR